MNQLLVAAAAGLTLSTLRAALTSSRRRRPAVIKIMPPRAGHNLDPTFSSLVLQPLLTKPGDGGKRSSVRV